MHNLPIRVLLVDDDEDDYILTREWLSEIEGARFELEWVATYDAALETIGQHQHDVYLLDYRLGKRNGLELLREAIANGCSSPIILLTGQGDHEVDIEAMRSGAADYLYKSQIGAPLLEHAIRYAIERKRTEQKIREQAALLDITSDAILVYSLDHKILFWNKGAERLYGWKADEVTGKDAGELLYKEALPQLQEIEIALAHKGEWQGEVHKITKQGQEIITQSRWTLVCDEEKKPKSILVVNTDITQKKQLEAQFLRAQRMESIGTLAGGIAHDLNNVLTPIMGAVQILQITATDERSKRLLRLLETNTKRGADLIKQVLSFARGLEGQRTIVQVGHLIREIEKIAKETFPKSIDICTDILTTLWPVSGDATQLHQVLMNLCVNARDAMPEGGNLSISAENLFIDENYAGMNIEASTGPYIVINVCDTGTGIPPSIAERIFEPFFTTKEVGKGTGLGLSTVIGIVKSHKGFVKVYSEERKGTQFRVYLPATQTRTTQAPHKSELLKGQGELILVVDDELAIREITKTSLETYNYRVVTASDGIEAIAVYVQHKDDISVVLTDMMMPSMDGQTTIRTLKKINPQVKIIAMSGLASNEMHLQAPGTIVKAFLAKPYTTEVLLKTINGVLSARTEEMSSQQNSP